jgi:hypothetical protein
LERQLNKINYLPIQSRKGVRDAELVYTSISVNTVRSRNLAGFNDISRTVTITELCSCPSYVVCCPFIWKPRGFKNFSLLLAANVAGEENAGTFGGNKFALISAYRVCCPDYLQEQRNGLGVERLKIDQKMDRCVH